MINLRLFELWLFCPIAVSLLGYLQGYESKFCGNRKIASSQDENSFVDIVKRHLYKFFIFFDACIVVHSWKSHHSLYCKAIDQLLHIFLDVFATRSVDPPALKIIAHSLYERLKEI